MKRASIVGVSLMLAVGAGCQGSSASPPAMNDDAAVPASPAAWSMRAELTGVDLSTVWGVGGDVYAAGAGGAIARSIDGGQTFAVTSTGLGGQPQLRRFSGSGTGDVWLVGDDGAGAPVVLHSSDRGASWQPQSVPGLAAPARAVWSQDATHVLLATADGKILHTLDGGATWATAYDEPGGVVNALWVASTGVAYAAGERADALAAASATGPVDEACDGGSDARQMIGRHGGVWRSTDGGASWASVGLHSVGGLRSLWGRADDGSVVVAVGANSSVALTSDGGETWIEQAQAVDIPALDISDVWVSPGDGALFFAAAGGPARQLGYDCVHEAVQFSYEAVPPGPDGSREIAAVWGSGSDDVWAAGPRGLLRHRQ